MQLPERQAYNSLLKKLDGDIAKIHRAIASSNPLSAWRTSGGTIIKMEADWRELENLGIRLIMNNDHDDFPPLLKEIPDAPLGIYVMGDAKALIGQNIAIVGTRKVTSMGLKIAGDFSRVLAKTDFNVVSGLALGIDAAAHAGTLLGNGATVAVLPGGLDQIYPANHRGLAEKPKQNGALVSEYPPGRQVIRQDFLKEIAWSAAAGYYCHRGAGTFGRSRPRA